VRWTAARFCRAAALAAAALVASRGAAATAADAERRAVLEREIDGARRELEAIHARERSALVELQRLDAELRLRRAEAARAGLRIEATAAEVEVRVASLARLVQAQAARQSYLAVRLRELYKQGPGAPLRVLLDRDDGRLRLDAARYALVLGGRDARLLQAFRDDAARLTEESGVLLEQRLTLEDERRAADAARTALAAARVERARFLESLRADARSREAALAELEAAAADLGAIAGAVARGVVPRAIDPEALRGRMKWPVDGKVRAGFGRTVHPEFKTSVPHPGLDIDAPEGADFRAAADGTVVWSGALRGYGLTTIVDHGADLLTVYGHAGVLLVEKGEGVQRGDVLGKVGDTGSLRGPALYFEVRRGGKPVDPAPWLEAR
jgi:septal ring factor EnvC (AmiA/AmiB activator)